MGTRVLRAAVLGGGLLGGIASATTMVRLDLRALAHAAQLIVRGRCVSARSMWENGTIWTLMDFQVMEAVKGGATAGDRLTVRLPGGRAGHLQTKVDGVPDFSSREEVILFLERTSAGDWGITGWKQGTFRVRHDGSRMTVTQESSEFPMYDRRTRSFMVEGIQSMEIGEFRRRLRAIVGQ